MVTECDGIYCGGGVHAAFDLALYLVEKLIDRPTAVECSKSLLIDMPRVSQSGFSVLPLSPRHSDSAIQRAEEALQHRFADDVGFEALAAELGMSPRNFIRRFKNATGLSPIAYRHKLRVEIAKRIIEDGSVNVQEVSEAVGYTDAAFFRRLFQRYAGVSPSEYRRQFAPSFGA